MSRQTHAEQAHAYLQIELVLRFAYMLAFFYARNNISAYINTYIQHVQNYVYHINTYVTHKTKQLYKHIRNYINHAHL